MPAEFSTRTSGDAIADRRFAYGEAALAGDDALAACDLFRQTIELVPEWPPAHFMLAKAALALGAVDEAQAALRACLALDPADRLGAGMWLAREAGTPPAANAMADAYVAALFDEYAPRFDEHLVKALNYRAPGLLRAMVVKHAPHGLPFAHVLDLGCGSGLMARALEGAFRSATGVDLSAGMLAIARGTGLYARLECASLTGFLDAEPQGARYDLVIAADVFCYVPDLAPVFAGVHRFMPAGGLFAFSIQSHPGQGAVIGPDARVHHAPGLIRDLAARHGFRLLEEEEASTRKDRGVDVAGALFVLRRF